MVEKSDGWNEWSKHVLKELERLSDCYQALDNKLSDVTIEIAMLKVKSGIWGAVGAACTLIGVWLMRKF